MWPQLGRMKLHHGDCAEILKSVGEATVDLIVTSPPYPNVGMPYGDRYTESEYLDFSREWLREAMRVLAPTGSLWLNVGYLLDPKTRTRTPLTYLLFPLARELGFHLQQEVVWAKPNRIATVSKRFTPRSERWMWFVKSPKAYTFNRDELVREGEGGTSSSDVWEFAPVHGHSKERPDHPCPFPIPMIDRIVRACSNPGDLVLDPFAGSGTTGVVAVRLGRRFVGIEREPKYVQVAQARLHDAEREQWATERQGLLSEIEGLKRTVALLRRELQERPKPTATSQQAKAPARDLVRDLLRDGRAWSVHEAFAALGGKMITEARVTRSLGGKIALNSVKNVLRALAASGVAEVSGQGKRHDPTRYRLKRTAEPRPRTSAAFTFVDAFAGIGGMRIAFEAVGGECVFSSEIDPAAIQTYEAAFRDTPAGDIRSIQPDDVPDHDVFVAGFPCTSWSIAGKRAGFDDPRGALFFNAAELIRAKRPRAFLLENVKGLGSGGAASGLNVVQETLRGCGYQVCSRVFNALDFGLPQRRQRVMIVGFRDQVPFEWPEPSRKRALLADFLDPAGDLDDTLRVSETERRRIADALTAKGKQPPFPFITHTNFQNNVTASPHSVALRASASTNYIVINGVRRPSSRELLNLQGFPRDFPIVVPHKEVRRQTGNTVPVPMIRAVAEQMIAAMGLEFRQSLAA